MKRYREDPLFWLEDRLGEDPRSFKWSDFPEYEGHIWDGDRDALANAWLSIANKRWAGVEAATGTSKTYFLSRLVMWFLDVYPDSLVVTSAPKQDQLKLHLWAELSKSFNKFKQFRDKAAMYTLRMVVEETNTKLMEVDDVDYSKSWQCIGFVAGAGSDEDSATKAQGFHREHMLIILEETPGMPRAIMTAFQNTCTGENNLIMAVGNPDSELDLLHEFCQMKNVDAYRISAYDYPNVVAGREFIKGAVTQKSIDFRKAKYGEEHNMYLSRVRGISPKQSEHSLIKLTWIMDALARVIKNDEGYNAVGVDVSNSEAGDKAALAWGEGATLKEVQDFHCQNATHLAYNLFYDDMELHARGYDNYHTAKLKDYNVFDPCIGIDAVGVGVATVNAFKDLFINPTAIHGGQWTEVIPIDPTSEERMYNFASFRSQIYWELREDLRLGLIAFAVTDYDYVEKLKKELTAARVMYNSNTIAVEKKEDIKRRLGGKSPNIADAVAYWNWVRKGYRFTAAAIPFSSGYD